MAVRVGLVGYGVGGRLFHAPYMAASEECELVGVVTRSSARAAEIEADHAGLLVLPSLTDLLDIGVDAVVVSTPPDTRDALVREALAAGVAVVADKPFAPSAAAGRSLCAAADDAGVLLNVFHNRRLDADIVTARDVLTRGVIGDLTAVDLRCDQDDPSTLEQGPAGGLLRDLGSHVVDQALHLAGPAETVFARLEWRDRPAGRTDTAFILVIEHRSGVRSVVSSSKLDHLSSRELRLHGTRGSYVSDYHDVQIEAIRRGERPVGHRSEWGVESSDRWGVLTVGDRATAVPSAQGDYTVFYDRFAQAVADGSEGPVPAREGVAVLEVLDAARRSDEERRAVSLSDPARN